MIHQVRALVTFDTGLTPKSLSGIKQPCQIVGEVTYKKGTLMKKRRFETSILELDSVDDKLFMSTISEWFSKYS